MASDLKIQGVVEMSSEGAERAFDRIGQKADSMAAKVTQTSGQAGQAVDQIGAGADRSATEFTRAEGRIVSSIKRATTELQNLGKTASQRLELRIDTSGLDKAKFEPLLANLRELERAQTHVVGSSAGMRGGMQNLSYQMQDFIVQVNGGTSAAMALSMNLPQLLGSFGALGAGIGVVAALLPNLIALFSDSANEAESLKDAMSGMDDAISQVGRTVQTFDMEGLYEEFNAASGATRAATIEQLNFQRAFIETQRLVSQKAFSESLSGIGDFSFLDKLSGGGTAGSRVADDLGVTLEVAQQLAPVLKGLRDGTEDVGSAFTRFGTQLLSGNNEAIALATAMRDLASGEKDAYAASSALSEALERMSKGHVRTKKEAEEAAKASKKYADETQRMAEAGRDLVASLLGQSSGLSADFFKKWQTLGAAYKAGAISLQDLTDAQASLLAQQPAMKQAAKDAEDYGKALASTVGALEQRALALEAELSTYGLTKSEIERTTIARLEEVRAMAAANGATDEYLRNVDREIEARKRIASATAGIEVADANKKAAEKAAQEWERTAEAIEESLIDALMEGGKSGAEYIEGLFRTMVLRPVLQAIVQPIAGGITNAMGFGQPGASGGGSFGLPPGVGSASMLSNGLQWAGTALGSTALGSFGFGMTATSSQIAGLSGAGLINGGAASAGATFAAAMPYIGVALFAAQALGLFDKKPSDKTSAATYDIGAGSISSIWDMGGKKAASQDQKDANAALSMLIGGFAQQAGLSGQIVTAMGARDGTRLAIDGGFRTPMGAAAGGTWLGDETAYSYGSGTEAIQGMLDDLIDEGTLSQETIDRWKALKTNVDGSARDAVELVDTLALINQGLSDTEILRADLIQAEGETLGQAATRVRDMMAAFAPITADEAWTKATRALADEFGKLGQAMPQTATEFARLINSLDLTTDAGQDAYRAMTSLAPAFLTLASVVDEVFASISKTTAESVRDIQLAVLDNAGKYAFLDSEIDGLLEKLSASTDPSTVQGLFEQINAKTTQAFNLLDEDEQKRLAGEFVDRLYEAESLAQQRLSVAPLDYQPQQAASKAQQDAAAAQSSAAADLGKAAAALSEAVATMTNRTGDGAGALIAAGNALGGAAAALSNAARYSVEVG